ncbi:hypothetical protein KSP39_PZI012895 [Platanthera zijinensis]|uniref:Mitochondrial protein n=1 Tax=Platanthera zijinensis TaxID=2320716 RepID=A0AAP0BBR9_9ASPA
MPTHSAPPHMVTRAQNNIFKPKKPFSLHTSTTPNISLLKPTTYTQASKDPRWRTVMLEEYNALLHHNTWTLEPPPSAHNIIGCKWAYRIKKIMMVLLLATKLASSPRAFINTQASISMKPLAMLSNLPLFISF